MIQPHVFYVTSTPLDAAVLTALEPLAATKQLVPGKATTGAFLPQYASLASRLFASGDQAADCVLEHHAFLDAHQPEARSAIDWTVERVTFEELKPWPDARERFLELVFGGYDLPAMAMEVRGLRASIVLDDDLDPTALPECAQNHVLLGLTALEQAAAHFALAATYATRFWVPKP